MRMTKKRRRFFDEGIGREEAITELQFIAADRFNSEFWCYGDGYDVSRAFNPRSFKRNVRKDFITNVRANNNLITNYVRFFKELTGE